MQPLLCTQLQPCELRLEVCGREMRKHLGEVRARRAETLRCQESALMGSPTVMGSELLTLSQDHHYRVQKTSDHRWLSCHLPTCSAGDITTMNQRDVGKRLMMSHGCQEEP